MHHASRVILASSSPFRSDLLAATGLVFSSMTARINESDISPSEPRQCALDRSIAKARDVASINPECIVIGADQVLEFNGQAMGKVRSQLEAKERLEMLSGRTHLLWSAYCLLFKPANGDVIELYSDAVRIPMEMKELSSGEIEAYLRRKDQWQGVVGCYKYEELGGQLFLSVGGDHSSIIGLPIMPLMTAIRRFGINPLIQPKGPWPLTLD